MTVKQKLSNDDLEILVTSLKKRLDEKTEVVKELFDKLTEINEIMLVHFEENQLVYNSKRELEIVFDASEDYVVILDKDKKIKRANKLFCNLVCEKPRNVVGTSFTSWFGDELTKEIQFDKIIFPTNKFTTTTFYSNIFQKVFKIKSRKLKKDLEPLVYIHITKEISE